MLSADDLKQELLEVRRASFFRLRGGYPIPLAGAIWWALLGGMGYVLKSKGQWTLFAFVTSGTIFPLAILLARICRVNFLSDKTVVTDALFPTFVSMFLFWPLAISSFWNYPELVPLILAIGMSIHWPVIGWTYGQTALYSAHAIVRAVTCFVLWNWLPSTRFTVMPFAVSLIYLLTVGAILFISSPPKRS